ncbi:MAG: hypothetical protein WBP45_07345 [Daejeonella sp.]
MKKLIFQVLLLVAVFFTAWFVLSKIDWLGIFKVKGRNKWVEKKMVVSHSLLIPDG